MKKRLISILTVLMFLFNFIPAFATTLPEIYYSNLRVALNSMSATNLKITFNSDYLVKLYQGGTVTKLNTTRGTSYSLTVENSKIKYLDKLYDKIEVICLNDNGNLTLQSGNASRSYRGDFRFILSSSKILPINIIDVENYLEGVIGYEIGFNVTMEAFKAQAVAARTYALNGLKGSSSSFDLYDDTNSQVYRGIMPDSITTKKDILKAINDTSGEVILYDNKIIAAYFSASNGGYTEQSGNVWSTNLPYLDTKEDVFDKNYNWTRVFSSSEIESRMISNGKLASGYKFSKLDLSSIKKFQSGRLEKMNIELYKTLTKDELLKILGISENITNIQYDKITGDYIFILGNRNINRKITDIDLVLKTQKILLAADTALMFDLNSIIKAEDGSVTGVNLYFSRTLNKTDVRTFLNISGDSKNLLSSLYTVSFNQLNNTYTFTGSGYGHGIGLSQIGAANRAKNGQTYKQILAFYFPNTTIQNLNSLIKDISLTNKENIVNQAINVTVNTYKQNLLYEYVVEKDGTEILRQDYTDKNTLQFTPSQTGNYRVVVNVKTNDEQDNSVVSKLVTFKSFQEPNISKINLPTTTIYKNKVMTVKVDSINGTTLGKQYEYEFLKGGKSVYKKTQNLNTISYTPTDTGEYVIKVKIKDNSSKNQYDDIKEVKFNVNNEPIKLNINRTLKKGAKGTEVKILQEALIRLKYLKYSKPNSVYDTATINAVKAFQKANKLTVDGIFGSGSKKVLEVRLNSQNEANKTTTNVQVKNEPIKLNINRILKKGAKGTEVKILQEALIRLKYLKYSKPNSVYDTATINAVKAFQKANKLTVDGIFGSGSKRVLEEKLKIQNAMVSAVITNPQVKAVNIIYLKVGSKGNDVLKLQNRLRQLGYLKANYCTGYYGNITQNALKAYQKKIGLPQTGVLDTATYNKIYK